MILEKNEAQPENDLSLSKKVAEGHFYLILSILWMGVIFAFSHQAYSGRITEEYLHDANIPVRKLGHVSEFAILSLLYFKTLVRYSAAKITKSRESVSLNLSVSVHQSAPLAQAFLLAFLYACLDEWHQSFVPGRSSSFYDVLVDTTGILIALGLTYLAIWRKRKKDLSARSQ